MIEVPRARSSLVCYIHVERARVDIPRAQVRSYNVRPRHLCKVMGTNIPSPLGGYNYVLRRPLGMPAKIRLTSGLGLVESEAGRFIVPRRSTRGEKPLGISTRSNRTSNWGNTPRDDDRIRSVFHQDSPYISVLLMWIRIVLYFFIYI